MILTIETNDSIAVGNEININNANQLSKAKRNRLIAVFMENMKGDSSIDKKDIVVEYHKDMKMVIIYNQNNKTTIGSISKDDFDNILKPRFDRYRPPNEELTKAEHVEEVYEASTLFKVFKSDIITKPFQSDTPSFDNFRLKNATMLVPSTSTGFTNLEGKGQTFNIDKNPEKIVLETTENNKKIVMTIPNNNGPTNAALYYVAFMLTVMFSVAVAGCLLAFTPIGIAILALTGLAISLEVVAIIGMGTAAVAGAAVASPLIVLGAIEEMQPEKLTTIVKTPVIQQPDQLKQK